MLAVDLIRSKRDGEALDRGAIEAFVRGVTDGSWPDYQIAALLMAILLRGMSVEETAALTDAMVRSGARITYDGLPAVAVDKHSTGGVGDKTSLVLAPLVAACGAPVPMMSGRALGHTGGTLDKLESIPGFRVDLSAAELRQAIARVGCALIGQTAEIVPADRRLYALRDVTATVESLPLITASIMSKKIAEGIGGLVLDVKAGSGAFMKTRADARRLAEALVATGRQAGVRTEALVTAMDSPLGRSAGNAVEVIESLETLKGRGPADVTELSVRLAAIMLVLSGLETTRDAADRRIRRALASGAGLEKLRQIIENQGGDPRVADDYGRLPSAPDQTLVRSPRAGYVAALDAGLIGRATMTLGAGRDRIGDAVDHGVGLVVRAPVGSGVSRGEPVVELHHRHGRGLQEALAFAERALRIADEPVDPPPLVLDAVRAAGDGG